MILGVVIKSHYFQVNYLINGYLPSILTWYFLIQTKESPSKFCIKSLYSNVLSSPGDNFHWFSLQKSTCYPNCCWCCCCRWRGFPSWLTNAEWMIESKWAMFTLLQMGRVGNYCSSLRKKHLTFGWHDNDIRVFLGFQWHLEREELLSTRHRVTPSHSHLQQRWPHWQLLPQACTFLSESN